MRVALDSSCLVALLCAWHEDHDATRSACEAIRRESLVIAGHALVECYSVMTRLPAPYRISPQQAEQVLSHNFKDAEVTGLTAALCWTTIREQARRNVGGGQVYDAIIARSVRAAGAVLLLTWNVRDFLAVAPPGLEIREPARTG